MGESTTDIGGYKIHPAANVFPMMGDDEYERLVKSIEAGGLRVPIVVFNGMILDGRNRLRACVRLGIEPRVTHFEGSDPVDHVVALNLTRRHLNESQRSMVAAKIANLQRGGDRGNQHTGGKVSSETLPVTQTDAATKLNVSRPSVLRARKVLAGAVPEAIEAVERGDLTVNAAAELAALPTEGQRDVLSKAGDDMRSVPRLIRESVEGPKPKYQRPKDPKVAERDEQILAVYQGTGLRSAKRTADIIGCTRGNVHDALERAGLNTKARSSRDPLRGFIENTRACAFAWNEMLEDGAELWEGATDEQRAEAVAALKSARQKASQLITKIEAASTEAA